MLINQKLLTKIIKDIESQGVKKACQTLLKDLGVKSVTRSGYPLPGGPLLIISNHPGVFDSLILMSQVERDDLHFIALATYGVFGPKVQEKLLPIYRVSKLHHKIYEYPLSLQTTGRKPEKLSLSEIRTRNRATIARAAELINQGKAVSIFPTGAGGKKLSGSTWKAGVGYLVKQITNSHTQVVFVKISGTRKSDIVAYFHQFISKIFFHPRPVNINFSQKGKISKFINIKQDEKTISRKLETIYNNLKFT